MNLDEQIQETIVRYLDDYAPDHKDCECSNCLYFIHELKKELLALIAQQVKEATINGLIMAKYGTDEDSKEERFINNLIKQEQEQE